MTRIKDSTGLVHFRNPADRDVTLCGEKACREERDLLEIKTFPFDETSEPVTCKKCARVYCAVKNEPWPSVDDEAMNDGIFDAVKPDGVV